MKNFTPIIHRYEATVGNFFVNVFLVETENGVVAIDSALALSSVKAIRDMIQSHIKKNLKAVLLTHGHPDHYTGIGELIKGYGDIPVLATKGTIDQAMARDREESGYLGSDQAFGPEYPKERIFPNTVVKDGEIFTCDGVDFCLTDLGPCESDSDSMWSTNIGKQNHVFSGDIVYNHMHTFFRDGHTTNWLRQIDRCIQTYDHNTIFHTGHGKDMGIEIFYWQKGYIEAFVGILKSMLGNKETLTSKEKADLFLKMQAYLPNDKLLMLTTWQFEDMVKVLRKDGII